MKKVFLALSILVITPSLPLQSRELKIYRSRRLVLHTSQVGMMLLFGFGSSCWMYDVLKETTPGSRIAMSSIPSVLTFLCCAWRIKYLIEWYAKIDKPVLIFDEQGFIYEKPLGIFGTERATLRYSWNDIRELWEEVLTGQYGIVLERYWCYRLKTNEVIKVSTFELDLSKYPAAMLESVRRGHVQVLVD